VDAPPILQRHPALRWLAPIGVAGVAGIAATGFFGSSSPSTTSLPPTTPSALIAAVQQPRVSGFSGTVVSHLSLGLPEVPTVAGADDVTSFASLLTGSHTMQVWYGGADRQRVALLGATDETDVFRDGREIWEWSSADRSALHAVLPSSAAGPAVLPSLASLTPLTLAQRLLTGLEPTTRIAVDRSHQVADRSAYDLVLTPRTALTKVGQARITIDGRTKMPLGVQMFARGETSPSLDVSFTKISFARQADRSFRFSPPAGATVHQLRPAGRAQSPATAGAASPRLTVTGSGWATVLDARPSPAMLKALRTSGLRTVSASVSGPWGKGYLLDSDLVSVLVTNDGRVLIGAVPPSALLAAAGSK
jgi:hypothetical protein